MARSKSRSFAIIISYISIFLSSISNLVLTKLYVQFLGIDTYGHYQMINAVGQYIILFDFGISATVMRFRVAALTENDRKKDENLLAHCLAIVFILNIVVVLAGFVSAVYIGAIYPSLSPADVSLSRRMIFFLTAQIAVTLGEHYLLGLVMSEERYTFAKAMELTKISLRLLFLSCTVVLFRFVMVIFYVDLFVSALCFVIEYIYIKMTVDVRIKFHRMDGLLLRSILYLMLSLVLQSIATYVNNAAGKTILGIMMDKSAVAVYSFAITINSFFNAVPNAINSTYVPTATQMVMRGASGEELTDLVIRPGRFQYMFCGAVVAGFSLFGKFFIHLWAGTVADQAWICAIILIVPCLFPLVQNVCLSILTAMNKRLVRSLIVVGTSVINILLAVLLVPKLGVIGVAVGTAASLILGNIIITNIYYSKGIGLDVIRMFREIFRKTTLCILISSLASAPTLLLKCAEWVHLLFGVIVFVAVYAALLWLYGMNDEEKMFAKSMLSKFKLQRT